MTDKYTKIDVFNTNTFDGYPVELTAVLERNDARIRVSGLIRASLSATLPKDEAFRLYHQISILTYSELRKILDI